jgi:hypothetical protein
VRLGRAAQRGRAWAAWLGASLLLAGSAPADAAPTTLAQRRAAAEAAARAKEAAKAKENAKANLAAEAARREEAMRDRREARASFAAEAFAEASRRIRREGGAGAHEEPIGAVDPGRARADDEA